MRCRVFLVSVEDTLSVAEARGVYVDVFVPVMFGRRRIVSVRDVSE